MQTLYKKLWKSIAIYYICFVLVLFLLEFFKVRLEINKIFDIFGVTLQIVVALLTFFAVIALFRLEGLRSLTEGGKEKTEDIIRNLSKYGIRIAQVIFFYLIILFLSVSNKAGFLNFEFKLHVDTIILSFLVVSVVYVLDGVISSLGKENLK
ncbi:MAG: hypothetical protein AAB740_02490 [Patescibacteria group bacterium]